MTILSFLLTHQFFGNNPGAEHLVNATFHAANAVLLFVVLLQMTGAMGRSAAVAAIFAWHPLRVESVCWISERKDVLFVFFMLLSLLCYVRYARRARAMLEAGTVVRGHERPWNGPYILTLVFFVLSFMSKGTVVTLPFLLLLLDYWPLGRFGRTSFERLFAEKVPFFGLSIVFSAFTFWVHQTYADVRSLGEYGLAVRFENVTLSYLVYLGHFFWPWHLALLYPFPRSFDRVQVGLGFLLLAGISALCVLERKHRPYLAVGWFWYLGTMVPVINLVQIGEATMGDRHTYMTLVGPTISLVWLIGEWAQPNLIRKCVAGGALGAALGLCVLLTRGQMMYWQNTVTLFEHTIAVTGENGLAQTGLAIGLEHEGLLSQAAVHYRIGLALAPGAYLADVYYGGVLIRMGHYSEAVERLKTALTLEPRSIEAMNRLAWTLATCPDAGIRNGPRAVQLAERACALTDYKYTRYMRTLAAADAEAGRFSEAISAAQKVITLSQRYGETKFVKMDHRLLQIYLAHNVYHKQNGDEWLNWE